MQILPYQTDFTNYSFGTVFTKYSILSAMLMSIRNPNLTDVFYDAALHNHYEILKYCNEFFNFIVGSGGLDFPH